VDLIVPENCFKILSAVSGKKGWRLKATRLKLITYKLNNNYEDNLSRLLASYCERIPNQKYINQVNILIKKNLKNDYSKFLANNREYVITNICPKCSAFGLHKPNNITSCSKCKFEIKIASNIPIPVN